MFFPIVPTRVGTLKLRIDASGSGVADRIEKDFLVEVSFDVCTHCGFEL